MNDREDNLREIELPEYLKEIKRLTDEFFDYKKYLKPKEEPDKIEDKN